MISYQEARRDFIKLRNEFETIINKTSKRQLDYVYGEKFGDVYTDATVGDIVAQDYLGYVFKRGKEGLVPENIDLSMKWLILAAANGNPLSLQRLSIFLNYAYDEVINQEDFETIAKKNRLNDNNFAPIVGKLFCEAIVDELKIDPLEIIKEIPTTVEFTSAKMGFYDKARNKVIPVVLSYLRGNNPHKKENQQQEKQDNQNNQKDQPRKNK